MALDPSSVGAKGTPTRRSWTSKDSLLYAVGVGAGTSELAFTTENTKDTPQRVLPTQAVILGGGGVPMDKAGEFNPALMVHGTEGIELYREIPAEGEIESIGEITGVWDKGKAGVLEFESTSTLVETGEKLFKVKMSLFCRGAGDFGGERGPSPTLRAARAQGGPRGRLLDPRGSGADLPALGRPEPAPLGPLLRGDRRFRPTDPARPLHLRVHGPGAASHALRLGSFALQEHGGSLQQAGHAWRRPHDLDVGGREQGALPDEEPGRRRRDRPGRVHLRLIGPIPA